jgi:DNA-binding FadR family transcriptional regulator
VVASRVRGGGKSPAPAGAGLLRLDDGGSRKGAEVLALELEREILRRGWPEGELLGTEPELLDRYGISRAVLREAIRLLETRDVAEMRRGGNGGLRIKRPGARAAVRPVALYLESQHVTARQLQDVRIPLELLAIETATKVLTEADVVRLREALEAEASFEDEIDPSIHDVHLILADIAGNPVLRLFIEVLTKLAHSHEGPLLIAEDDRAPTSEETVREIRRAHQAIVDAVIAGDASLASRRMLKHMTSLTAYID